jgi:alpha-beta hydrolase superfamily lysophospholipase
MILKGKLKRIAKVTGIVLLAGFILLNIIAFNHAYRFSHFAKEGENTGKEESLTFAQKIGILFTGITKTKPVVTEFPRKPYSAFTVIHETDTLKGWTIPADSARGIIIMGHGYAGNKGTLLNEANAFNELSYAAVLFDFKGHGESSGYRTTVGYTEAEDAAAVYNYIRYKYPDKKIYLYGVSMGAVAMLRSVGDLDLKPDGLIMECPYGSMLSTAQNRFRIMRVPSFPSAQLLVFWGGVQNGFWGFANNSYRSAENVNIPTLILYGKNDARATEEENREVFENLKGPKEIVSFNAGHESYYKSDTTLWKQSMERFFTASR